MIDNNIDKNIDDVWKPGSNSTQSIVTNWNTIPEVTYHIKGIINWLNRWLSYILAQTDYQPSSNFVYERTDWAHEYNYHSG